MLLLGWRGISTFQLPLQLKRCFSCQHFHHQMVPRIPISHGLCQGTRTRRWRTSAASWLWVWAQQQTRVPPTLHFCTSFKEGFFFHSSEPTNLQHNQGAAQLHGGKKHLFCVKKHPFCVKNHPFCMKNHPFWFPLDSFVALLRVCTGRGASGFVVLSWTSFSPPFQPENHSDVLLHCQKSWECWCWRGITR